MRRKLKTDSSKEMIETICRACLVAKDAAFNVGDYIATASRIALVAVQQCERELDEVERQIDQSLPSAISEVDEAEARELLACLKFITDLERIGDLLSSAGNGIHQLSAPLPKEDKRQLQEICDTLQKMLADVYEGFVKRDETRGESVLRADPDIDRACHRLFRRHLQVPESKATRDSTRILFIAQALERAGDHAKNLGEEVIHLVRGRSLRHASRTRRKSD
jgi:phosphate transport system protein